MSTNNELNMVSQKVQSLMTTTNPSEQLNLPKQRYEPFFLKVMNDFKNHHKLPDNIPPPQGNMMPHKLLSYILDLMTHSMGELKRNEILSELSEYKMGLPFDLR